MAMEFRTRSKTIQADSEDIGACCTIDESNNSFICDDNVRYIVCKRNQGIFRGKGSTCLEQGCPTGDPSPPILPLNSDLHGACKTCSGCVDNLLESDCITQTNFDADFFAGTLCSEVEDKNLSLIKDQKYGCCIDNGGCFDTCNPSYCSSLGGTLYDGEQTELALLCSSNPCSNIENDIGTGACCRAGECIGQLTQMDCVRNNGEWIGLGVDCSINGDFDCSTSSFRGNGQAEPPQQRSQSESNGSPLLVCSRPTPKKYYDDSGKSNLTQGPTYDKEPVWVTLVDTIGQCQGGIISSEDGDISKATMWGGCQYPTDNGWVCESKISKDCTDLGGKWWPGIYCDDIRSFPASGLLYATEKLTNVGEKYLAGSCHLIDTVQQGDKNPTINCGDMQTQYQCANALQKRKDYYLKIIDSGNNVNWTESDLNTRLRSVWSPGRPCTKPSCETDVPNTDMTLGLCQINTQANGVYWNVDNNIPTVNNYTYHTGRQKVCMDNYTKSDCEILHGEWEPICLSCEELGLDTPVSTGSCCTSADECLSNKTYLECQGLGGFFHGPGTSCEGRDCGKVAFLEPVDVGSLGEAKCKCIVAEEPISNATRVFARQDAKNANDIWAGSTCGDPTVDAVPFYDNTNFASDTFVLYRDAPPISVGPIGGGGSDEIYTDSREIGDLKYIFGSEPFNTFIVSDIDDGSGTFLDDIVIEGTDSDNSPGFFRVDKKEPINIPITSEVLKNIKGVTLETNVNKNNIYRLILNDPDMYWTGGNGNLPLNRKIKYVNFSQMTNLRHLGVRGFNYPNLQSDFENSFFPFLTALDFSGSNLSNLNTFICPALERLNLNDNNLTTLDLSSNEYLTSVDLAYNNLSDLTFAEDSIYLADLRVGYNPQLSQITGTYPQLESFFAQRCNFSTLDFSKMPFLKSVQLQKNPLQVLNISKCPSLDVINLDSCFSQTSVMDQITLPNQTNRTLTQSELPDSISEADIPSVISFLNTFSFRNNTVQATGYDDFVKKMADTIAITRFTNLNNTTFNAVGNFENRGDNPVYCETIDLSNVIDTVEGDTASVKKILEYIFGGITNADRIQHTKKIRIILTGINSSVDYSSLSIIQQVLNRMSFII